MKECKHPHKKINAHGFMYCFDCGRLTGGHASDIMQEQADRIAELREALELSEAIGNGFSSALFKAEAQLAELREANRWIPVEERLPPTGIDVLVAGGCAYYIDDEWWSLMGDDAYRVIQWKVTHWMPLPLLPEEGK